MISRIPHAYTLCPQLPFALRKDVLGFLQLFFRPSNEFRGLYYNTTLRRIHYVLFIPFLATSTLTTNYFLNLVTTTRKPTSSKDGYKMLIVLKLTKECPLICIMPPSS